jgi:SHS2 domain-containing protein
MTSRYEVFSHTADTGIVAYGACPREVFENAAYAMFDLMFGIDGREGGVRVRVSVSAPTVEDLLVDWLSVLLFEAETNDLAFCSFEIDRFEEDSLTGWAAGFPVADVELSGPPIKAVTYHELTVQKTVTGWSAQVIFDV